MSVSEILGIIRLSNRQAEGRRTNNAVLCLKYLFSLAASFAALLLSAAAQGGAARAAFAAGAAAAALLAALRRGLLAREMYRLSESFLRLRTDGSIPLPNPAALLCGELVFLAAVRSLFALLLAPALLCLRSGIRYYSLSADRHGLLLLLGASMLLAAAGLLFAAAAAARLGAAEYLWLSGQCGGMPAALGASWELTRGDGGDMLRLKGLSFFCGTTLSALGRMNLSKKLLRQKGLPLAEGLTVALLRDPRGEMRPELIGASLTDHFIIK